MGRTADEVTQIKGRYLVTFSNGDVKIIDVEMSVVNHLAHPLYLVDVNEKIYNWHNIVSIQKV